jgi:hypothetical protein
MKTIIVNELTIPALKSQTQINSPTVTALRGMCNDPNAYNYKTAM